jgi:hypothetical protein
MPARFLAVLPARPLPADMGESPGFPKELAYSLRQEFDTSLAGFRKAVVRQGGLWHFQFAHSVQAFNGNNHRRFPDFNTLNRDMVFANFQGNLVALAKSLVIDERKTVPWRAANAAKVLRSPLNSRSSFTSWSCSNVSGLLRNCRIAEALVADLNCSIVGPRRNS